MNDFRRAVAPPLLARWLLRALRPRDFEFAAGDLEEGFHDRVDSPLGARGARRWYWREVRQLIFRRGAPRLEPRGSFEPMDHFAKELRHAARGLRRAPAFSLVTIVTLALGIGANTAIFSVVDAVLLRPLPFRSPDRLAVVWETDASAGGRAWRVTPANFVDFRAESGAFEDAAAFGAAAATLTGRGEPRQLLGASVSPNYFAVLGVAPAAGRDFRPEDRDQPVVVLGHGIWQSVFGGSRDVIGGAITLDGAPHTVIGVAPPGILPAWPVNGPRIHFDAAHQDYFRLMPGRLLRVRRSHVLGMIGRLSPGVTLAGAQDRLATVARRLAAAHPENKDSGVTVRPLLDEVAGAARPALLLLLGAAGVVLLLTCANVANLLLARLTARRQEIAVRLALGAGRGALLRQFLAEGLLLAGLGAALGAWLARLGHGALLALLPLEIPRLADARLDWRVLAFTAAIAAAAAVVFALAPLWSVRAPAAGLRESGRGGEGAAPQRARAALITAQVALAVVLTIAAGLLIQSFAKLGQVRTGFRPERLLIADLVLPASQYPGWRQVRSFYAGLLADLRQQPGVASAQIAYDHPLDSNWLSGFAVEGQEAEEPPSVNLRIVSPGYFAALGYAQLEGREFAEPDDAARPGVAVVNQAFARRYLASGRTLGRRILCTAASSNWQGAMPDKFEVIGVVGDIRTPGEPEAEPRLYLPAGQFPRNEMKVLVRSRGEALAAADAVRAAVRRQDRDLPLARLASMEAELGQALAQPRGNMVLMALFGGFALVLALVGVYGLVAYWVAARRRELGVRLALGASRGDVVRLVAAQGLQLLGAGAGAGSLAALALTRLLRTQLYEISPLDPVAFLAAVAAVLAAGVLACAGPARAAARVDPAAALRGD